MSYEVLTVRSVDQDMTQDRAKWNQVILRSTLITLSQDFHLNLV